MFSRIFRSKKNRERQQNPPNRANKTLTRQNRENDKTGRSTKNNTNSRTVSNSRLYLKLNEERRSNGSNKSIKKINTMSVMNANKNANPPVPRGRVTNVYGKLVSGNAAIGNIASRLRPGRDKVYFCCKLTPSIKDQIRKLLNFGIGVQIAASPYNLKFANLSRENMINELGATSTALERKLEITEQFLGNIAQHPNVQYAIIPSKGKVKNATDVVISNVNPTYPKIIDQFPVKQLAKQGVPNFNGLSVLLNHNATESQIREVASKIGYMHTGKAQNVANALASKGITLDPATKQDKWLQIRLNSKYDYGLPVDLTLLLLMNMGAPTNVLHNPAKVFNKATASNMSRLIEQSLSTNASKFPTVLVMDSEADDIHTAAFLYKKHGRNLTIFVQRHTEVSQNKYAKLTRAFPEANVIFLRAFSLGEPKKVMQIVSALDRIPV